MSPKIAEASPDDNERVIEALRSAMVERQRIYDASGVQSVAKIRELTASVREERDSREATQRATLRNSRKTEAEYRKRRAELEEALARTNEALRNERNRANRLATELAEATARLSASELRVVSLERSLSWKLTSPVRKAADLFQGNGKG